MTAVSIGAAKAEMFLQHMPLIDIDDNGTIELDDIREAASDSLERMGGRVVQDIPMLGAVTFKREDIDSIYDMIRHS